MARRKCLVGPHLNCLWRNSEATVSSARTKGYFSSTAMRSNEQPAPSTMPARSNLEWIQRLLLRLPIWHLRSVKRCECGESRRDAEKSFAAARPSKARKGPPSGSLPVPLEPRGRAADGRNGDREGRP